MLDDYDPELVSKQRADNAAKRRAAEEDAKRWKKTQKENDSRHESAKRMAAAEYFYLCADIMDETTPYAKLSSTDRVAVVDGLRYIHAQGLKSDWFRAEWAKEVRRRNSEEGGSADVNEKEKLMFFRKNFFEPFLVQNLMVQGADLAHDLDLGREWAKQQGKRLNTAYYVYRCAVYNVLGFLEMERYVEDAAYERIDRWEKVCKELRGLKEGEKEPAEPVYPLDPKRVLECANRWDRTIDANLSVVSGNERVLWRAGKIIADKTEERPGIVREKAKQRVF